MIKHKSNAKFKSKKTILTALVVLLAILFTWFAIYLFTAKSNQVTQAEADIACQGFFDEVKADITSVPGYTIIKGDKSCIPNQDEAGSMDYDFNVNFKVAKTGNDSVDGIKANINDLSGKLPRKEYPVWIRNQPGKNGQPEALCVGARKSIQETGEEYQSDPPEHYPKYIEPNEFTDTFTGSCANL